MFGVIILAGLRCKDFLILYWRSYCFLVWLDACMLLYSAAVWLSLASRLEKGETRSEILSQRSLQFKEQKGERGSDWRGLSGHTCTSSMKKC